MGKDRREIVGML